jgi:hypothetical protein
MKVNSVSDQMSCLKLGDLTCIHGQQNLADSAAQRRVLTVERPIRRSRGRGSPRSAASMPVRICALTSNSAPSPASSSRTVAVRSASRRLAIATARSSSARCKYSRARRTSASPITAARICPRGARLRLERSRIAGPALPGQLLPLSTRQEGDQRGAPSPARSRDVPAARSGRDLPIESGAVPGRGAAPPGVSRAKG